MSDVPLILVMMPIESTIQPVKGSEITPCMECLTPCWLSPSSMPFAEHATRLCAVCAERMARAAKDEGEPLLWGGFLPGQLKEIEEDLKNEQQ